MEVRKPARLNALTGLRSFAAVNIVLFHFSNPKWFGWLAPVVNAGYASVSFFILLSGFVLGTTTRRGRAAGELDKVRFWEARFTRLYPIYLLSLLLSLARGSAGVRRAYARHVLDRDGAVAAAAAGLDSGDRHVSEYPGVDHVGGVVLLRSVSVDGALEAAGAARTSLWKMGGVWMLGLVPGALYIVFNPDGIAHPDRWSWGPWLQALKYTPLPHLASFVFGVLLAELDEICAAAGPAAPDSGHWRLCRDLLHS